MPMPSPLLTLCPHAPPHATPATVLVADGAGVPWSGLGLAGHTTGEGGTPVNATVWKLFSREPLPHAWLSMMFERGRP